MDVTDYGGYYSDPHQYYAQQPSEGPYGPGGLSYPPQAPYGGGEGGSGVKNKFNHQPVFQDVWAALLFLLQFAAFVILSVLCLKSLKKDTFSGGNKNNSFLSAPTLTVLLGSVVIGLALSVIYLILMQRFTGALIRISFVFVVGLLVAGTALYAVAGHIALAVIYGIFAVFYVLAWFSWRSRIPFATVMLSSVAGITRRYPGTIGVSLFGLFLQMAFSVWWVLTLVGAYDKFRDDSSCVTRVDRYGRTYQSCVNGKLTAVVLFLLFSFYWTSQMLKDLIHVTVSGVFATHYFFFATATPIRSPTWGAFKRASTTSFGSVCFGSLIIALFNTVRAILRSLASSDRSSAVGSLTACCAECILGLIESIVYYFNHYAFTQVAIYGKSYIRAARDTWTLIKDRGIEAIINDNIINGVLALGGFLVAVVSGLFAFAVLELWKPAFNSDNQYTLLLVALAFMFGFIMETLVSEVISSGVATTFVCLAESPEALARSQPHLFEAIRQTYPQVAIPV